MKYYVVADVHGFYSLLKKALAKAGFFEETEPHKLVVCGDLLDRGDEANELINFMMRLLEEDRLIYIFGNHEELFLRCLQEIAGGGAYEIAAGMSYHYRNGTWDTLLQIADMTGTEASVNPNELVRRCLNSDFHRRLLPACVDYYETPNYVFTHGWIPCFVEGVHPWIKCRYDEDWRKADGEAWRQARWINGIEVACQHHVLEPGKTVVCGHWRTSYGHSRIHHRCTERGKDAIFEPFLDEGIIALDGCTAGTGIVNCIVIED